MIGTLSRRERLIVVGGAVALALVAGWELVIAPLIDRSHATSELVPGRQEVLARRQDLVARRRAIQTELDAANARIDTLSGQLLASAAPAVAAAEVSKIAKDMAAQSSADVRSERILPPVEHGELLEIPVEIAVSGEIRQLVDLLSRLEEAPKVLTVQELRVRVVNVSQPKELLVTLTISGYLLPGKAKT